MFVLWVVALAFVAVILASAAVKGGDNRNDCGPTVGNGDGGFATVVVFLFLLVFLLAFAHAVLNVNGGLKKFPPPPPPPWEGSRFSKPCFW